MSMSNQQRDPRSRPPSRPGEKKEEIVGHVASYDWDLEAARFLPEVTAERYAAVNELDAFAGGQLLNQAAANRRAKAT